MLHLRMIRRWIEPLRRLPTVTMPPTPVAEMSPLRRRVALAVIAFVAGGHVLAFATHTEPWPFSRYQLYSKVYSTSTPIKRLYLVGLTPQGEEIPLSNADFAPLDGTRLRRALGHVFVPKTGDVDDATEASNELAKWLFLYDQLRESGRTDGPDLAGLRIYKGEWFFRGDASNAKGPPNKRFFIVEYDPQDVAPPVVFDEFTFLLNGAAGEDTGNGGGDDDE